MRSCRVILWLMSIFIFSIPSLTPWKVCDWPCPSKATLKIWTNKSHESSAKQQLYHNKIKENKIVWLFNEIYHEDFSNTASIKIKQNICKSIWLKWIQTLIYDITVKAANRGYRLSVWRPGSLWLGRCVLLLMASVLVHKHNLFSNTYYEWTIEVN